MRLPLLIVLPGSIKVVALPKLASHLFAPYLALAAVLTEGVSENARMSAAETSPLNLAHRHRVTSQDAPHFLHI
jgi:hypothetical protein